MRYIHNIRERKVRETYLSSETVTIKRMTKELTLTCPRCEDQTARGTLSRNRVQTRRRILRRNVNATSTARSGSPQLGSCGFLLGKLSRGAAPEAVLAQQEGSHLFEEEGPVKFNAKLNVPGRYMARRIERRGRQIERRRRSFLLVGTATVA